MHAAFIVKLENVKKHPGADRLQIAQCLGSQVIIDLTRKEGEIGVFFPDDGKLSDEMLRENNLYSHPEKNKDPSQKGYIDESGRVKTLKLRGERSEGIWLPLQTLEWTGVKSTDLSVGYSFSTLMGKEIYGKYYSSRKQSSQSLSRKEKKERRHQLKDDLRELREHFDTQQIRRNLSAIRSGDLLIFTAKSHGTSGRTGYLPVKKYSAFQQLINRYLGKFWKPTPRESWEVISGTRRVIINPKKVDTGFYSGKKFRVEIHNQLSKLNMPKGLTLFYEIVGWAEDSTPIQKAQPIAKIQDKKLRKELEKSYGKEMVFSYGCDPNTPGKQYRVLVYRATMLGADREHRDLSWQQVKGICLQLGLETVKEVCDPFTFRSGEAEDSFREARRNLIENIETYLDKPDPIDPRHILEGVCVRQESPSGRTKIYKDKSFIFRLLESHQKDDSNFIDIEEEEALGTGTELNGTNNDSSWNHGEAV
jgi:hypothetical protein